MRRVLRSTCAHSLAATSTALQAQVRTQIPGDGPGQFHAVPLPKDKKARQTLLDLVDSAPQEEEQVEQVVMVGSSNNPLDEPIPSAIDTRVGSFLDQQEQLQDAFQQQDNEANVLIPKHPDDLIPEFKRVKHSQKIVIQWEDDDAGLVRRDNYPLPPPAKMHPWVNAPIGPHIVHGDGQQGIVGTGEVGFENETEPRALPESWRGLQPTSNVGQLLPDKNGTVTGNASVRHSLTLTGRGLFATNEIKEGDLIMVVASTAAHTGFKDYMGRLCAMTTEIILNAYKGGEEERNFLHQWVLTGQTSALVNHFPKQGTERVLEDIGGQKVLDALELHEIHIARIAAIVDLNSMVVESAVDERRGAAFWPEAAVMNHSCAPNATYDILPEHAFRDSEYFEAITNSHKEGESDCCAEGTCEKEAEAGASPSDAALQAEVEEHPNEVVAEGEAAPRLLEAPSTYLMCCRATKDIAVGEEILISYIPVEWNYEARQTVLHDRYKFWCKCIKCAPVVEKKQQTHAKLGFGAVLLFLLLTYLVYRARMTANDDVDHMKTHIFENEITKGMVDYAEIEKRKQERMQAAMSRSSS